MNCNLSSWQPSTNWIEFENSRSTIERARLQARRWSTVISKIKLPLVSPCSSHGCCQDGRQSVVRVTGTLGRVTWTVLVTNGAHARFDLAQASDLVQGQEGYREFLYLYILTDKFIESRRRPFKSASVDRDGLSRFESTLSPNLSMHEDE